MVARRTRSDANRMIPVDDYEHAAAKRTNNPPAGLAHLDRAETPTYLLNYDPHLDPQLIWAGKAESAEVGVPAPSIHVHEELSAEKIIGVVRRQRTQQPLFDVADLDPAEAVEFYAHDLSWSNRMVLGDSLLIMTSLLERERLGGQVQCVYVDPPYGIKYGSNFQPDINNRDVKDRDDASLTREPEMIQAYRDTWRWEVHSYLTYLRDRFTVARELLSDTGSIFVQIGEENVARVRLLLDEVFGADNFVTMINYVKTSSSTSPYLGGTMDYILWFAKDRSQVKYRPLYTSKADAKSTDDAYVWVELVDGARRRMTAAERANPSSLPPGARRFGMDNLTSQSAGRAKGEGAASWFPIDIDGKPYTPSMSARWKTNEEGMARLLAARRVALVGNTPRYVRYLDDFTAVPLSPIWDDTVTSGFAADKRYVVQSHPKAITRCLLMTTDPGDLVLDPTCGSGTTAQMAEQYGRRWITCDTSRVALAIARERVLTSRFEFYELVDPKRGVDAGLKYRTLPRVTLRSVARAEEPELVTLYDEPLPVRGKIRVSGPFTVEALSRYAVNPLSDAALDEAPAQQSDAADHVQTLLDALQSQGIPRPGGAPAKIESLTPLAVSGTLQAEGIADLGGQSPALCRLAWTEVRRYHHGAGIRRPARGDRLRSSCVRGLRGVRRRTGTVGDRKGRRDTSFTAAGQSGSARRRPAQEHPDVADLPAVCGARCPDRSGRRRLPGDCRGRGHLRRGNGRRCVPWEVRDPGVVPGRRLRRQRLPKSPRRSSRSRTPGRSCRRRCAARLTRT